MNNINLFDCSQPYLPEEVYNSVGDKRNIKDECNNNKVKMVSLLKKYNAITDSINKINKISPDLSKIFNKNISSFLNTNRPALKNQIVPSIDNIPNMSLTNILTPSPVSSSPGPSLMNILTPSPVSISCSYTPWSTMSVPVTGCKTGYQYQTRNAIDSGKGDCIAPTTQNVPVSIPSETSQCSPCSYTPWTNNDYTITGCKTGIISQTRNAIDSGKGDCIAPTTQNIQGEFLNDTSLCAPCTYTPWTNSGYPNVIGCKKGIQTQIRNIKDAGKGDCVEPIMRNIITDINDSTRCSPCSYSQWTTINTPVTGCKIGYQYQTRMATDGGKGDCVLPIDQSIPVFLPNETAQCPPCSYTPWTISSVPITGCKTGYQYQTRSAIDGGKSDCNEPLFKNVPISIPSNISQCSPCSYSNWVGISPVTVTGCKIGTQTQIRIPIDNGKGDCSANPPQQITRTPTSDVSLCPPCTYTPWTNNGDYSILGCKIGNQPQIRNIKDSGNGNCDAPMTQDVQINIIDTSYCDNSGNFVFYSSDSVILNVKNTTINKLYVFAVGGGGTGCGWTGPGGGGGGVLEKIYDLSSNTTYFIDSIVGNGGIPKYLGRNGDNTIVTISYDNKGAKTLNDKITAYGGGTNSGSGGSGGGSYYSGNASVPGHPGGAGVNGQGYKGGDTYNNRAGCSGGGGAGGPGKNQDRSYSTNGQDGGPGRKSILPGIGLNPSDPFYGIYFGGGGGGAGDSSIQGNGGIGGGGGAGCYLSDIPGNGGSNAINKGQDGSDYNGCSKGGDGGANTGGGGGGGGYCDQCYADYHTDNGGKGGSGIVIIAWDFK